MVKSIIVFVIVAHNNIIKEVVTSKDLSACMFLPQEFVLFAAVDEALMAF